MVRACSGVPTVMTLQHGRWICRDDARITRSLSYRLKPMREDEQALAGVPGHGADVAEGQEEYVGWKVFH